MGTYDCRRNFICVISWYDGKINRSFYFIFNRSSEFMYFYAGSDRCLERNDGNCSKKRAYEESFKGNVSVYSLAFSNMAANILGLGWAATPAGLKAMKELKKLEESNKDNISKKSYTAGNIARMSEATYEASDMMCAFLVLNISSLQLIPINMIAYRSQYGSVNPTAVVLPAILATMISTLAGILFIKGMEFIRYNGRNKKKRRRLR